LTIRTFTTPQSPAGKSDVRGLGWDIDSRFSGNRGDLFPIGSYGHTGFTGTSIWIDPYSRSWVILLANSVHPRLRPAITSIRGRVASAAAAGLNVGLDLQLPRRSTPLPRSTPSGRSGTKRVSEIQNGIDVLVADNFRPLAGKK